MRRSGADKKRLLIDALRQQPTLGCCEPLVKRLASVATQKIYKPKSNLILQDSDDNDLAFIISGRVGILVKGEKVAERHAGQHVGEMSVIDPAARRSATVVAIEKTNVAWVKETDFSKIASDYPDLWRNLARELAVRLRQRGALLRDKNPRPVIFIGSSSESSDIATAIKRGLSKDPVSVKLWTQGVFGVSEGTIESLEKIAHHADFAILILSADDKIKIRKGQHIAPRDNVLFELGLFMGALGRPRTFMVVQRNKKLRLPPDLDGVTHIPFQKQNKKTRLRDIEKATAIIRQKVAEMNVR